jgi:hypothetical protein
MGNCLDPEKMFLAQKMLLSVGGGMDACSGKIAAKFVSAALHPGAPVVVGGCTVCGATDL